MKRDRTNRLLTWTVAAAALLGLGACDEGAEPDDQESMSLMDDGDFMGDRDLQWQSAGEVPMEGTEHVGVAEVEPMSDSEARVTSERIALGPLGDRVVTASIQPVGFDPDAGRDMAFALFVRTSPDMPWESFSLPGTVGDTPVQARTFGSIRIDRELNSMELAVVLPSPDGVWVDHFARVVRLDPEAEIALAPTPVAAWDQLEGAWEFELDVRCGGTACL